jgi:hypothetical protein
MSRKIDAAIETYPEPAKFKMYNMSSVTLASLLIPSMYV